MNYIFGDSEGSLSGMQFALGNYLMATLPVSLNLVGDVSSMSGNSKGAPDILLGIESLPSDIDGAELVTRLIGDALTMAGHSQGGSDEISGSDFGSNYIYGDAISMRAASQGGDDLINVGNGALFNFLNGDAIYMREASAGGDDIILGADNTNSQNYLVGDASYAEGTARGGNDRLISLLGVDYMYGDFMELDGNGANLSQFGQDTFVLSAHSGRDYIFDFQRGLDKIDLTAKGITGFEQLAISEVTGDIVLSFENYDAVLLAGVSSVDASDFIFAAG